jgi:hypothetical protein
MMIAGSLAWAAIVSAIYIALIVFHHARLSKGWPRGRVRDTAGRVKIPRERKRGRREKIRKVFAIFSTNIIISGWPYITALAVALIIPKSPLGIVTVLLLILSIIWRNCLEFAFVLFLARQVKALRFFWTSVLPHGVFELPAIFFILGHALWLATSKGGIDALSSLVCVGLSAALMLVAALAEVYVTPMVVIAFED